ncbi:MAG: pilus assembly protein PilP [Desulfamplus sp.]|nr:pilus assembly protein PilP [Desulfamplus sp.]
MICFRRIRLIYIFMPLLLMVLFSCEKKAEEKNHSVVQEVVSMKITPMKKEPVQSDATDNKNTQITQPSVLPDTLSGQAVLSDEQAVSPPPPESGASNQTELTFNIDKTPKSDILPGAAPSVASIAGEQSSQSQQTTSISETTPNKTSAEPSPPNDELLPSGDISGEIAEEKLFYIAKGKTDPFAPLIKEKPPVEDQKAQEQAEEDVPERILTPLEKLDFGQMKLVAILSRESGSVAMVQEATGKGYIVNIGTYMGRNSGQVISIEKDKLVIQEKVKDYKGNIVDSFQELKLNKLDDKG